jgi:hypothetical protein
LSEQKHIISTKQSIYNLQQSPPSNTSSTKHQDHGG